MKLPFLIGAAVGYVLGTRAGRDRYEALARTGRRIMASQTVQSTAGVLQAQLDDLTGRARGAVGVKLGVGETAGVNGVNGHHYN